MNDIDVRLMNRWKTVLCMLLIDSIVVDYEKYIAVLRILTKHEGYKFFIELLFLIIAIYISSF